jgi:TolB protein
VTAQGPGGPKSANITVTVTAPPIKPWFVYSSDATGEYKLYKMNVDGTGRTPIATPASAEMPAVSKDGTKVAYSEPGNPTYRIRVMDVGGANNNIVFDPGYDCIHPTFSPDGTKIAFAGNQSGVNQIYVMNSDGTGAAALTNDLGGASEPRFSPDGTKIVFTVGGTSDSIAIMDTNGANRRWIANTSANEMSPCFNIDGTTIVFIGYVDNGSIQVGQLMSIPTAGGTATRLSDSLLNESSPCFSTSGTTIIFCRDNGTNIEVYRKPLGVGSPTAITSDGAFANCPRSPGQ